MDGILKKIKQSDAFNRENRVPYLKVIVLMSLFTFVFLGAEFLFVNMISRIVSGHRWRLKIMRSASARSVLFCILFYADFAKGMRKLPFRFAQPLSQMPAFF